MTEALERHLPTTGTGAVVLTLGHLPRRAGRAAVALVVCAGVVGATVESVATRDNTLPLLRADVVRRDYGRVGRVMTSAASP